jgi:hypothetical protein
MHPHISTHIFCYYSESTNPHIFHSDPLRKLFYSYSGSELQKIYIIAIHFFFPLLAKKSSKYSFLLPLINISQKRLGSSTKKRRERKRERKKSKRKRTNVLIKKTLSH